MGFCFLSGLWAEHYTHVRCEFMVQIKLANLLWSWKVDQVETFKSNSAWFSCFCTPSVRHEVVQIPFISSYEFEICWNASLINVRENVVATPAMPRFTLAIYQLTSGFLLFSFNYLFDFLKKWPLNAILHQISQLREKYTQLKVTRLV